MGRERQAVSRRDLGFWAGVSSVPLNLDIKRSCRCTWNDFQGQERNFSRHGNTALRDGPGNLSVYRQFCYLPPTVRAVTAQKRKTAYRQHNTAVLHYRRQNTANSRYRPKGTSNTGYRPKVPEFFFVFCVLCSLMYNTHMWFFRSFGLFSVKRMCGRVDREGETPRPAPTHLPAPRSAVVPQNSELFVAVQSLGLLIVSWLGLLLRVRLSPLLRHPLFPTIGWSRVCRRRCNPHKMSKPRSVVATGALRSHSSLLLTAGAS